MALFSKTDKDKKANAARASKGASKPAAGNGAAAKGRQAKQPTAAEIQEGLVRSQRASLSLGEIINVLIRSRGYRAATLGVVHALAAPAIASGQFAIARAHSRSTGLTAPVAVALWANVSELVDRRLSQQREGPTELRPDEWTSGNIPWLIAYAGDARAINQLLVSVQSNTLKGHPIKLRTKAKDGKFVVRTLSPKTANRGS